MTQLRTTPSAAMYGLLWVCAACVPAIIVLSWILAPPPQNAQVNPREIQSAGGAAYGTPIALRPRFPFGLLYGSIPDDFSNPARSTLVIREDGIALGPAHTLHEQIRAGGRGAFSHWAGALIFSSSDGTDPRTNGRLYTVEAPVQLRSEVISGALALFLICAVGLYALQRARAPTARDRLSFQALMLGVTILLAGIEWRDTYAMSSFDPLLSWDSISFLTGSTFRGFAYTTLLNASIWLLPSGRLLVPLQLTLLIISFATVGWSVARVTSNSLLGWLTTVVLLVDTRLTRFSLFMLSDAIFIALVAFHFAALLSVIRRPSTAATVLAGLSAGLAILVRPAGYTLLLTIPMVAIVADRYRLRLALQAALPAAALLVFGTVVNFATSGALGTQSIGGLSLLGHVLPLATPDVRTAHPDLYRDIVEATAPAVTSVNASYPAQYWFVTSSEYNKLLWGIAVPRITVYVQKQAQLRGESGRLGNGNIVEDDVLAARINRVSMDLALAIVAHHPAGYARHAAAHLYGMWANVFAGSAPLGIHSVAPDWPEIAKWQAVQAHFRANGYPAERLRARFADGFPPLPSDSLWSAARPGFRVMTFLAPMLTIAAVVVVSLGWIRRRPASGPALALAFCSLHLWAYFALVAAVQAGLNRYSAAYEPVLIPIFTLAIAVVIGLSRHSLEARRVVRSVPVGAASEHGGSRAD